jgi:hypothetical protein
MDKRPPKSSSSFQRIGRLIVVIACVLIGAMWLYAFVFASRESINRIYDDEWAARSQTRCEQAATQRTALANLTRIDENDPATLMVRADLVDKATDTLETMLNDIESDQPSTEKGLALVPKWIADYRLYIEDRRDYTAELRTGSLPTFSETLVDDVPVSERVGKFARENKMRACQPPFDLIL